MAAALKIVEDEPTPARSALSDHLAARARINEQSAKLAENLSKVRAIGNAVTRAQEELDATQARAGDQVRRWVERGQSGPSPMTEFADELAAARNRVANAQLEADAMRPVTAKLEAEIANLEPSRQQMTARLAELVLDVALEEAAALAAQLMEAETYAARLRAKLIGFRQAVARPVVGSLPQHNVALHRVQRHLETEPPQPRDADIERARIAAENWLRMLPADAAAAIELE